MGIGLLVTLDDEMHLTFEETLMFIELVEIYPHAIKDLLAFGAGGPLYRSLSRIASPCGSGGGLIRLVQREHQMDVTLAHGATLELGEALIFLFVSPSP